KSGVESDRYTRQRLKNRLKKRFVDEIVFHQPPDRSKPELVYSSSISLQDLINEAFRRSKEGDDTMSDASLPDKDTVSTPGDVSEKTRILYKAAMIIKADINTSSGISIQPLDVNDLTVKNCKEVVPESLYWLLRWVISVTDEFDVNPAPECKNAADEKRIVMLGQDIVQCSSHGRIKTPKHASLAMAVRHLTGSKQLITILSRMGHCCSYDETEVIDTSLAMESLAKAEETGVVIPSNISPGKFIQFAGDNNDINEETLDGKQTTHATTLVIYQKGDFAEKPARKIYADHSKRRRTLESHDVSNVLLEFGAFGKRPNVKLLIDKIPEDWFKPDHGIMQKSFDLDLAWNLVRLLPQTLFHVDLENTLETEQFVPGWSGFHATIFQSVPSTTSIGYCPMINGNPTEYSTVYTVLKTVQKITSSVGQATAVITFDLAIYVKAKEIQWRVPDELKNVVVRMGGFHIALNYLSLLGKMYSDSGLEDLLIESGVYASGTTSALMAGKQYNRGVRAHKLTFEALFRLQWQTFVEWLSEQEDEDIDKNALQDDIEAIRCSFKSVNPDCRERVTSLQECLNPVKNMLDSFKKKGREESQTFAYWDNYMYMVQLLLSFIKSERTGDWVLHLCATKSMAPYYFAMDRTNYSRWLPVYLIDMQTLGSVHPAIEQEFVNGNHAVSRSKNAFAQVWTDMALEQSVNLDSKSKGGIIGIRQKAETLERWFITCHERAAITSAIKEICGIEDSDRVGSHKESSLSRIRRDEDDVRKLMDMFSSGMLSNPFVKQGEDNEVMPLVNFASGTVMPRAAAEKLIQANELGAAQMNEFIAKRLKSNAVSFWDALPNLKIPLFTKLTETKKVKVADEKTATIAADRELFGRLIIAAKARDIDVKDVLTYELSSVPFALAHSDGALRKVNKSTLLAILERDVPVSARISKPNDQTRTCLIIDGMALIQMMKT
ncbi:MAG: hypothetical protein N0C90_04285, partial [Candidatus Thiodiazotropha endolucinida]|nr:hypothetical protein [Candidatus Thiodiazotropha taylori]MCW4260564.1 hypothetical protein [Candidatus Thiodiazotropha endolucinida]